MRCHLLLLLTLTSSAIFAEETLDLGNLGTPDPWDIEYPDGEPHSASEVMLGKQLFFDNRLSKNQNQSCATCHNPDLGFSDGMAKGLGTNENRLGRNAPHIYNLAWSYAFFWDGRASTLEEQALGPIESTEEMGMTADLTLERLSQIPHYQKAFSALYSDGLTFANVGRAIAAFERSVVSDDSPFDRYLAGEKAAISPSAERGLELFVGKAGCIQCHDGVNFTDDSFHNIGIGDADPGRAKVTGNKQMQGAFKTPGLRNIVFSAPYMHDGSMASLEEVVEHYAKGGVANPNLSPLIKPLDLSAQDKADLVAFMAALTDPVDIQRPQLP